MKGSDPHWSDTDFDFQSMVGVQPRDCFPRKLKRLNFFVENVALLGEGTLSRLLMPSLALLGKKPTRPID